MHAAITYCSVCKLAVNPICRSILSKFTTDFICRSFIDSFKKSTIISINKKRTTVVVIATARMKSVTIEGIEFDVSADLLSISKDDIDECGQVFHQGFFESSLCVLWV